MSPSCDAGAFHQSRPVYLVLLVLLVPINLFGLLALVASFRSRSSGALMSLGILALLSAATGLTLGFFGVAEMDRASRRAIAESHAEERAALVQARDQSSNVFVATGIAGTLIPWIGAVRAIRRARRLDD